MNRNFQVKFLQYLLKKDSDEGLASWGWLIVIIPIILILAALSIPSLFGCVNKAKQAEAKNYTGVFNRSQQAYYLENSKFASSFQELQLGIMTQTVDYNYYIKTINKPVKHEITYFYSVPRQPGHKSYVGAVTTMKDNTKNNEILTQTIGCETESPTQIQPANPTVKLGVLTCPNGTVTFHRDG
jgi:type IV pilus assembly protein PilA